MSRFRKGLLIAFSVLSGGASAEELVVDLTVLGGESGVVFMVKDGGRYLLAPSELEALGVSAKGMVLVDHAECGSCVVLDSIGTINVDEDAATATLQVGVQAVERLPQRRVSLSPFDSVLTPQKGRGFAFNYTVNATGVDGQNLRTRGLFEGVLPLGDHGLIRHGQFVGEGLSERLFTRYQYDFPESLERIVVGDAVSNPGAVHEARRFFGVSYSSDFTLIPGFREDLEYNFQAATTVPAQIDIYRNGDLVFQEEVGAGQVVIEDVFPVAGRNSIVIVVRDELGREQVIEQELFDTRNLLSPGQTEFTFDLGVPYDQGAGFGSGGLFVGRVRRGVDETLTVDAYFSAEEGDTFVSAGVDLATAQGAVSIDAGAGARDVEGSGLDEVANRNIVRVSWLPPIPAGFGAFYLTEGGEEVWGASGATRFELGRGLVGATLGYLNKSVTAAFSYERSFGPVRVGLEASRSERDTIVLGRLVANFGNESVSLSHEDREERSLSRLGVVSTGHFDGQMAVGASASTDSEGESYGGGFVGANTNVGDFLARYDRDATGVQRTTLFASGGMVFGDRFDAVLTRRMSPFDGVVLVDAGVAQADVRIGNRVVTTGQDGRAAAAVPGWRTVFVSVDSKTLPVGYSLGEPTQPLAVYRGHIATVRPQINAPGFFVFPERRVSEIVVDGRMFPVYEDFGAYVEVPPGVRTFLVAGEEFEIEVPDVGLDAPEFTLTSTGTLIPKE